LNKIEIFPNSLELVTIVNNSYLYPSDSLIMSRLQQQELGRLKKNLANVHHSNPLINNIHLHPFIDPMPIKFGLDLGVIGTKLFNIKVERNYLSHDLESLLSKLDFSSSMEAIARLNPPLPIFYQIALQVAYEELFDQELNIRLAKLRSIALEFARVRHHIMVIRNVFKCLQIDSMIGIIKTVENIFNTATSSYTMVYPVSADLGLSPSYEKFDALLEDLIHIFNEFELKANASDKLKRALSKKAKITLQVAASYGLTGSFLRANRNSLDVRKLLGSRINYQTCPTVFLKEGGCALSRFLLRIKEVQASLTWLKESMLANQREVIELCPLRYRDFFAKKTPAKLFATSEIAGPEGNTKVSIFHDAHNNSLIFRVRTPAYYIAQAIGHLLSQHDICDIPIVLYSLGILAEEIDK